MHQWAFDVEAQAELCEEVGRERCVPDWLMVRVHSRGNRYLHPSAIYPSLEAYIDATRVALDADVLPRSPQPRPPTASAAARRSRPSAPGRRAPSAGARPTGARVQADAWKRMMCFY